VIIENIVFCGDASVFGFIDPAVSAAIDRFAVFCHPFADFAEYSGRSGRDPSLCVRSDIQQKIAAFGYAFRQFADTHDTAFEIMVIRAVSPVVVHGNTGFPGNRFAMDIPDAIGRDDLFRRHKVAGCDLRMFFDQRAESFAAGFEPVVENDAKGVAPFLLCYTEIKRL
jgi:hypothetical protein